MEWKRLMLTGDDFGRSAAVNEAVERACEGGLLTQASLMVHEAGVDEAVRIARRHPGLCVGLHLTLCAGHSAAVSALTDARGRLPRAPGWAGLRYAFEPRLIQPLRAEIRRQFEGFLALGFAPSYWDGHAHLHLHPTLLRLTLPIAGELGFRFVRLVREPGPPPALIPWIFQRLSQGAVPRLRAAGIGYADRVWG
ncbi:MAG: ChbG/HpnK family deacetylase, partial [Verrucomicrobiota bacterium]|nr:ChbG/HpnK family deacetylase [Verrucomicrobiota bacterium]